jgi:sporulation protein YlmC with PRC-barrel domain
LGNDLGEISDVRFDPKKGINESLVLSEREEAPASLLGARFYAAIFGSK